MSIEKMNFKRWVHKVLPAVYDESLSYYELLCKITAKLNEVIEQGNTTAEGLQELKDYVDHYFDNLDVQEEINHKLDDMAESGELTDIIAQYLQLAGILAYNSVAEMKQATNLVAGSFAETYGYYANGDGGSAKYKIRQVTNQDTEDDMFIIALHDTNLVAELIIEDKILNVLKVGVKNDNSVDISTKINTLTENYSLFLPAGQYKVDNTLNLKHSLYGEGFSRDYEDDNGQTILNSSVIEKTINIIGNTEKIPQNVERIKIVIDDNTTSTEVIRYNPSTQTRCYVKEISIFNFTGIGINLNATDVSGGWISRGIYIDTICLHARSFTNSTGIDCESNVSDNRFSNLEMMFVQKGIINKGTNQFDNVHIWQGGSGTYVSGWWDNSNGLNNYGAFHGTNIYLDTSYVAIGNHGGQVYIDNFTYWLDDSISASNKTDGSIVFGDSFVDRQNVMLNNARIYIGNRIKFINGRIKNLRLLYDSLSNLDFPSLHDVEDVHYYLNYTQTAGATRYLPVAILQRRYSSGHGYSKLEITTDDGQNLKLQCSYIWDNTLEIKGTYFNKGNQFYYKQDGNQIKVYLESNKNSMWVEVLVSGKSHGMFPINLNSLENLQTGNFVSDEEILTSNTGLTQLSQTKVNP